MWHLPLAALSFRSQPSGIRSPGYGQPPGLVWHRRNRALSGRSCSGEYDLCFGDPKMTRAGLVVVLLLAVGARGAEKPCPQPLWTVDLSAKYHLRVFGLAKHPRNQLPPLWKTQQG